MREAAHEEILRGSEPGDLFCGRDERALLFLLSLALVFVRRARTPSLNALVA